MTDAPEFPWIQASTHGRDETMEAANANAYGSYLHPPATPNIWTQAPVPNWYMPTAENVVSAQRPCDTCLGFNTSSQPRCTGGRALSSQACGLDAPLLEGAQGLADGQLLSWPEAESATLISPEKQAALTCKWENCPSTHVFRREIDLLRHVKTIHVAPQAFPCPVGLCGKAFSRKDKLRDHMARVHQVKLE